MAPDALAARVTQLEEELATVQAQVGAERSPSPPAPPCLPCPLKHQSIRGGNCICVLQAEAAAISAEQASQVNCSFPRSCLSSLCIFSFVKAHWTVYEQSVL